MRRLLPLVIAATVGGCVTPSIPIPPPDAELMTFTISGQPGSTTAIFEYAPHSTLVGAVVFVYNRTQGCGIIWDANADGSVGPTAPVCAALADEVVVSFQREDQTASTCIRLREGKQDPNTYCAP